MPPQNTLPQNTAGGISFGISNLEPNDWETVDPGDWETVNPPAPPSPQFYQSPFSLQQQEPWSSSPQPTAPPQTQEEQDPWYHPDRLIPMGLRVGGGVTGGILGGAAGSIVPGAGTIGGVALGGGAGSYIGDALAQGYEYLRGDRPEGYNVKSGLVEGGLGAIPLMGKAPGLTAGAKELFKYAAKAPVRGAIEGGALGAASPVAHSLVERGEFPSWSEVGQGAGVGAGIGAVTAGGLASVPAVRRGRAAQSASTARAASRTNAINDILSGVETPVLPPVRPEGTVDLPVTKRTPVVPPQAFEPGTQVMIHDLPGVYEVQGSVSPETTAVRAPDGPPTIVRNERIIPIDEAPAISGYDPDRGIQWTSETWRQHVEQMGPNQDLMVSAIEDTLDRPMSVDDRIAANQKLDELEGAIDKGLQFVDPNTGEIRTASEAQPGDIPLPAQENVRDLHAEAESWERDQSAGPAVDPRIVANLVRQVTGQDVNVYGMQGGNLTPRTDTPAPPSRQITSGQPEILSERDYAQTVQHGDTVEVAIPGTGQTYWLDNITDDAQITDVNNKIRNGQLEIVQKTGGITQRNVTQQRRATKTIGRMELGPSPAEALPVRPDTANEVGRSVPPEPTGIPEIPELPQSLKGAKPRFNIGTNFYLPQFASDLDKALYIIAQTKPSKQDAQYLKFVMDNTGLDEAAARALGQQVRGQVRRAVDKHTSAGGGSGAVEIPIIASQTPSVPQSESGGIPSSGNVDAAAPPSTATGGAGGIPPIIPPVITGGTGEGGGQNIPPPGPPNPPGSVPQQPTPPNQPGGRGTKPPKPPILDADQIDPNIPVQRRKSPAARKSRYGMFGQAYNASRTLQSIDLPGMTSAAFRQSRPLSGTLDWFRAFASGAKAFGSDEALAIINDKVSNRKYQKPRYQPVVDRTGGVVKYVEMPSIAEELGLRLDDVSNVRGDTVSRSLAEKIPGYGRYVKASNRTNVAFLNDLASAKFEQLMDAAIAEGRDPRVDRVLGKKLADLVNNATGRASLKYFGGRANFEPLAEEIGFALWSPRYLSAKLAFMNPHNYITQDPMVRKEYWKGLARVGIGWGAATGLASMLPGAKVSFDSTNSDFGKVRFGNKRLDFGAGWLQLMVLTHREFPRVLGGGGTTSSTSGKFTPFGSDAMAETRFSLPGRYLYNQMSPSSRFIADMLRATQKQPVDLTDRMIQQALPMYATDIAEAAKGDPAVADFFAPFLSSMGAGVQEYKEGDFNKPKVTPFIEQVIGTKVPTVQVGK